MPPPVSSTRSTNICRKAAWTPFSSKPFATLNARRTGISNFVAAQGNLLEPVPSSLRGRSDLVVSTVPFLRPNDVTAALWEAPPSAYLGTAADGLGLAREVARQSSHILRPTGSLIFQVLDEQWDDLVGTLRSGAWTVPSPQERHPGQSVVGVAVLAASDTSAGAGPDETGPRPESSIGWGRT